VVRQTWVNNKWRWARSSWYMLAATFIKREFTRHLHVSTPWSPTEKTAWSKQHSCTVMLCNPRAPWERRDETLSMMRNSIPANSDADRTYAPMIRPLLRPVAFNRPIVSTFLASIIGSRRNETPMFCCCAHACKRAKYVLLLCALHTREQTMFCFYAHCIQESKLSPIAMRIAYKRANYES
jgi:hypothetical protein